MVKLSKIYTKTGDTGTTALVGGERVAKSSLRLEAYGSIDELNSFVGVVRTCAAASDDGEIAAGISNRSDLHESWDVELDGVDDSVGRISSFLNG